MNRALRSVSSEKGRDPREFALIAYGGAGPVHAAGLAEELGCRTVLVPALAGLFSSLGLLFARPEFHDVHACHLDARARLAGRARRACSPSSRRGSRRRSTACRSSGCGAPSCATAARRGRSRSSCRAGAARPAGADRRVRGRARAAVRRARRAGLADRDPRAAPGGARPVERGRPPLARRAAARPAGHARASFFGGDRSRRRCARARRSAPRPSRARCWSTSTTRRSSSARAGRCGATRRPRR